MNRFFFYLFFLCLTPITGSAYLKINVKIINQIGFEGSMFLRSELQSKESVKSSKPLTLQLENAARLEFSAEFFKTEEDYGPSEHLLIRGELYDYLNQKIGTIDYPEGLILLYEQKSFSFLPRDGRRVDVDFRPYLEIP